VEGQRVVVAGGRLVCLVACLVGGECGCKSFPVKEWIGR